MRTFDKRAWIGRVAARGAAAIFGLFAAFQLALALGAPFGAMTWGGASPVLSAPMRAASGAASIYLMQNLLSALNVSSLWIQVLYGGMLLIGAIFGYLSSGLARPIRLAADATLNASYLLPRGPETAKGEPWKICCKICATPFAR